MSFSLRPGSGGMHGGNGKVALDIASNASNLERLETINAPDAHQIALSWSTHEQAKAGNAGGRQALSGIGTTRSDTL